MGGNDRDSATPVDGWQAMRCAANLTRVWAKRADFQLDGEFPELTTRLMTAVGFVRDGPHLVA
jgi:hypothetical protein